MKNRARGKDAHTDAQTDTLTHRQIYRQNSLIGNAIVAGDPGEVKKTDILTHRHT